MAKIFWMALTLWMATADLAASMVFDVKEDLRYRYLAMGSDGIKIVEKATGKMVALVPVKAIALAIAYDRLYVAEGSRGVKGLLLAEAINYRSGKILTASERILNVYAFGIAIDEKNGILFLSGNQHPDGREQGTGPGISAWHFPDPRKISVPLHPLNPITFYPILGASGICYYPSEYRLYVACEYRGIGALDVIISGANLSFSYRGNALPPRQRGQGASWDWRGVGCSPQGELLLVREKHCEGKSEIFRATPSEILTSIGRQTTLSRFGAQDQLNRRRGLIFLAKFGQGFFSFIPDSSYVEALYKSEAASLLEEGLITSADYKALEKSVRRLETASRITGAVAFMALLTAVPGAGSFKAAGGVRGLIPALIKVGGTRHLSTVALDVVISNAVMVGFEVAMNRDPALIWRDLIFNTIYSTILSYAGLSPSLSLATKAKIIGVNSAVATHLTMNIQNADAKNYNYMMGYNLIFAVTPFLPPSSLTRYEAVTRFLRFYEANPRCHPGRTALSLLGKRLSEGSVVRAVVLTSNQGFGNWAYLAGDNLVRSFIFPDGRCEEAPEIRPFRVVLR